MEQIHIAVWGMTYNPGGTEAFIMNLYRNIDRKKVQFDFLLKHNDPKIAFEDEIKQLGGRVYRIIYSAEENYKKNKTCLIDFFNEHPEIKGIHVNCNFPYIYPLLQAKKAGVPIRIMHSHNTRCAPPKNIVKRVFSKFREPILKNQIASIPTHRFACSEEAGNWMFSDNKFEVINNGINTDSFSFNFPKRDVARRKLGVESKFVLGFIGRLSEQKNPLFLIDVFYEFQKNYPDSVMLIIGEGDLRSTMEEKIYEYGLSECVILTGAISDCAEYYQAMDCFLLPSKFEGLPVVLIEAQCSGLQCIVSSNVSKSANLTGSVIFLETNSAQTWAEKISEIKNIDYKRSSQQQKIIAKGYDSQKLALYMQEIYLSNT